MFAAPMGCALSCGVKRRLSGGGGPGVESRKPKAGAGLAAKRVDLFSDLA